jgi:hypothetical protein
MASPDHMINVKYDKYVKLSITLNNVFLTVLIYSKSSP